jgi:hypothetical protein
LLTLGVGFVADFAKTDANSPRRRAKMTASPTSDLMSDGKDEVRQTPISYQMPEAENEIGSASTLSILFILLISTSKTRRAASRRLLTRRVVVLTTQFRRRTPFLGEKSQKIAPALLTQIEDDVII